MAGSTTTPAKRTKNQQQQEQQQQRRPQNLDLFRHAALFHRTSSNPLRPAHQSPADLNKPLPRVVDSLGHTRHENNDDGDDESPTPTSGKSMEVPFRLEGSMSTQHHRPAPPVPKRAPNNSSLRSAGHGRRMASKTTPWMKCPMPNCNRGQGPKGLCLECDYQYSQSRASVFYVPERESNVIFPPRDAESNRNNSGTPGSKAQQPEESSKSLFGVLCEQVSNAHSDTEILEPFYKTSTNDAERQRRQRQQIEAFAGREYTSMPNNRTSNNNRERSDGMDRAHPSALISRYNERDSDLRVAPLRLHRRPLHTGPMLLRSPRDAEGGNSAQPSSCFSPYTPVSPLSSPAQAYRSPANHYDSPLEGKLAIHPQATMYSTPGGWPPSATAHKQQPRPSQGKNTREYRPFESFFECSSAGTSRAGSIDAAGVGATGGGNSAGIQLFTTAAMKELIRSRCQDERYDEDEGVLEGVARVGTVVAGNTRKVVQHGAPPRKQQHPQRERKLTPTATVRLTPEDMTRLPQGSRMYYVELGDEYPGPCPGPYYI
ncbi:hypothetical protein Micbo1qcDRAFT_232546 [Microdochium bolleyi]|uniref:Uncharacterized protein n=1 Tax=Microdochium bolleyi TaxID=196109 RepID=A0A136J6R7_9PEZI|nr:hypothetical protein Micbo1qcDRAFT_232546 [Microdochium bolleyi]